MWVKTRFWVFSAWVKAIINLLVSLFRANLGRAPQGRKLFVRQIGRHLMFYLKYRVEIGGIL
jgi:hypothetical protein